MKNLKHTISAALLLLGTAAFAQNFNPTVEVTNAYQGKPSDIHKPELEMAIPDSLLRFDLDFDYEVFNKTYDGAYSFKPYMLNLTPEKDAFRGHKLYVKAGAGYSLHPEFDFVFSPLKSGPLQMSFYASHHSYFGRYAGIGYERDATASVVPSYTKVEGTSWKGYDALSKAGFEGRYDFSSAILTFGAGYYGLMTKDTLARRMYNALDFNARITSNNSSDKYVFYDVLLKGHYGSDDTDYSDYGYLLTTGSQSLSDGNFLLHAEAGPVFSSFSRAIIGIDAAESTCNGLFNDNSAILAATPRYDFELGRWAFSLGVRVEYLFPGKEQENQLFARMHQKKGNTVYPAVKVGFEASDNVNLYASATGGADMNAYSSVLDRNHHFTPGVYGTSTPLLDYTIQTVDAKIGVKGNLWSKLQFDLNGGVQVNENAMRESVRLLSGNLLPCVDYADYNCIYANALFGLHAGKVRMDAALHYRNISYQTDTTSHLGCELPAFSGEARIFYDINARVYAGIAVSGATVRNGNGINWTYGSQQETAFRIPGYVDFGILGGYQITRKLGAWLESGNLLCQTIQRNLFYAEKGPWVTVGVTLTL